MLNRLLLIHDEDEEREIKENLMKKSGIPYENIKFERIHFKEDLNDYIHLMLIEDKNYDNKQNLIFIHGLSASSLYYFGILRELRKKFRVFAIDLPGMGWYYKSKLALPEKKLFLKVFLIVKIIFLKI